MIIPSDRWALRCSANPLVLLPTQSQFNYVSQHSITHIKSKTFFLLKFIIEIKRNENDEHMSIIINKKDIQHDDDDGKKRYRTHTQYNSASQGLKSQHPDKWNVKVKYLNFYNFHTSSMPRLLPSRSIFIGGSYFCYWFWLLPLNVAIPHCLRFDLQLLNNPLMEYKFTAWCDTANTNHMWSVCVPK